MEDLVTVERVQGEGWLVSIRGEHDLTTAPMLSEAFDPLFESGPFVVADIRQVTFMDTQTIGVFAAAVERAARQATTDQTKRFALVVDVSQSHVRRLLDLSNPIIGDVPTYSSRETALEALLTRTE